MDKNLLDPGIPVIEQLRMDDLLYVVRQTPSVADVTVPYGDFGPKLRDFPYVTQSLGLSVTELGFVDMSIISSLISMALDKPAWIRLYQSTAARDADLGRPIHMDPSPEDGVIIDASLDAPGTLYFNPVPWCVRTDIASSLIPITVKNLSDSVGIITVGFRIVEVK